jgi:hypothetical protein
MVFGTWPGPQDRIWDFKGRYGMIGGGTFSGKTELLRWYPAQQIAEDDARIKAGEITESLGHALYLRREMPLLRETMARCERDFYKVWPEVQWKARESAYVWPSGYRMTLGHMQNDDDWAKYASWQITLCLWDELPTFLKQQWDMLDFWVRQPAGSKLTPIHRAGGNPIGVGRAWVKKFFVDAGKPGTEVVKTTQAEVEDPDGTRRMETVTRSRIYIPAKVSDNKSVDQAAHIASFEGKTASTKAAMLAGDWNAAVGDLLGEAWNDDVHIVKPYRISRLATRFRSCHFAYAGTTVHWWDTDVDGNLTCYRDLHLTNHTAEMVAERVREVEEYEGEWSVDKERGSKLTGVLGPALNWPKTGQYGPSVAETFRKVGVWFKRADDNVQAAADQVRMRLVRRSKDPVTKKLTVPALRFMNTCTASLESIPSMTADKSDPDVPDPKTESSAYRSLCYAVMSRPVAAEKFVQRDDDWDSWEKPKTMRRSKTSYPGGW